MINAAIIGLGKMGLSHTAIVGANSEVNLAAVCDTSLLVLNAFKKFTKIRTYTDYEKMLNNEKLDFVIVATPTKAHYSMVKAAFEKGIHVFCEKPFTLYAWQGKELAETAKQKQLVNQVGFHNQFIGTFRELKRLLQQNVIGELVHFSGEAYGPVVTKEKGGTWRSNPEEGGGCLYDYASHVINLIQEIIGQPEQIIGSVLKRIYSKEVEDAVYALIKLKSGLTGTLLVNWSDETYRKMSTSLMVQGKKGKIICDATEIKIFLKEPSTTDKLDKGWTIKYITDLALPVDFYLRGEEYSAQIEYFINCVKNNKTGSYNTFEQALMTDLTIEMILSNSKTN